MLEVHLSVSPIAPPGEEWWRIHKVESAALLGGPTRTLVAARRVVRRPRDAVAMIEMAGQYARDWEAHTGSPETVTVPITKRAEGIAYLLMNGNLAVPCSRYGRDTASCALVAWRLHHLLCRETGAQYSIPQLDHNMGLVVNDHDDVAYIIKNYGRSHYV